MIIELGHYTLLLAFMVAILQVSLPLVGVRLNHHGLMSFSQTAATAQFLLIASSFAALVHAFVTSDFTLRLVTLNSHSLKPLIYKISGTWGNHEGSMLLWVLILSLFGASAAWFGGNLTHRFRATVLAVQGAIGVAFLGFVIFTSNPFLRLATPPFDGQDLNPLLQDPGLAFHPPFLYLGYVGLSLTFSFAVAALIEGRVDAAWARWVRPWTLAAWIFLTIGIALGSWWAYYELGWGGFWFWDPVENASFIPWLLAAALLHSAIVVEKRESLKSWTILLAILAFGFSLLGTFIVRSGLLTSVHAFANDPDRGVVILAILTFFVGGALILFAVRTPQMQNEGVFAFTSRESALILNNVLLAVSAFIVFVGTIWPLIAEIFFDRVLSVGPPFFNVAFTPVMVVLGLILPIGAMLPWKRGEINKIILSLRIPLIFAFAVAGLAWALQTGKSLHAPVGLFLGAWLLSGAFADLLLRAVRTNDLSRLLRIPRADWGKFLAHSGLGVTMMAIAGLLAWSKEDIRVVDMEETWNLGAYEITLKDVRRYIGPNYQANIGDVELRKNGRFIATVQPEKRFYPIAKMQTTEAGIDYRFFRDVYIVLGEPHEGGGWTVRSYIKPLASWIWGGAMLMAMGGLLSLSDRRLRIAAAARKTTLHPQARPAE
ncbi:MAG: heme lyase NrfEFG subunit NrfE [Rhodobacteraceae bacterium]|nr:heme lyase NrfEFG subunit NrfE [Paracoccaceae bacterium]